MMLLRALLAFLALPGVFALLVPPLVAAVDPWRGQTWPPGIVVLAIGALGLLWCVRDFYVSGKGTLAPWDPPRNLVVVGLYRHVRNPMYLGVLVLVAGWALVKCSPVVAVYTAALAAGFHLRVLLHEEPWLSRQFSSEWASYAAAVPRWIPRTTPWETRR